METLRIEIVNPKAKKVLKDLADLNLITISKSFDTKAKSSTIICRDSKDNFLLSLSLDSQANYLITGDNDLLELKKFGKPNILTITDFELLP